MSNAMESTIVRELSTLVGLSYYALRENIKHIEMQELDMVADGKPEYHYELMVVVKDKIDKYLKEIKDGNKITNAIQENING